MCRGAWRKCRPKASVRRAFAKTVKVEHYPTFEGGGLLWVYLGAARRRQSRPCPFLDLSPRATLDQPQPAPCNWLQGIEGTIDSLHIGMLHQSWIARRHGRWRRCVGLV